MCLKCQHDGDSGPYLQQMAALIAEHEVTFVPIIDKRIIYTVGMTGLGMPELYAEGDTLPPTCGEHYANPGLMKDFLQGVVDTVRHNGSVSIFTRLRASDWVDPEDFAKTPMMDIVFEPMNGTVLSAACEYYHGSVKALRVKRVPAQR